MTTLSVVIPSYKEEDNLKVILPRLCSTLDKIEPSYEIIIVDTVEPMDGTKDYCSSLDSHIKYINREKGNNFGNAVRTGIARAQGEYVIFMDADGSHDPEFISQLYKCRND